jgi:hypothetical protein
MVLAKAGSEYQVIRKPSVARLRQYFHVSCNTKTVDLETNSIFIYSFCHNDLVVTI